MSAAARYEAVEHVLLLLSESRERAEAAARSFAAGDGDPQLARALERVDCELLALHRRLLEEAYLGAGRSDAQLAIDAA
jgi:hypothetical protein